ncbi:hypothetical protein C0R04_04380 [Streptomyces albidoflavus]|nr:hypothetical protein C0R04_04380 [Streptomyces albidoflavus]RZF01740.1 hypothetical protein C0R03_04380 [Streptomyces albidoflavus]
MKPVGELGRWWVARAPGLRFSLGGACGDSGVRTAGLGRLPGEETPAAANAFALNLFATNMFVTVKW